MIDTPRGKYIAIRVGDPPQDEGEHFVRCPACGGWIDCRNLACVSTTEGREKHPAKNAQKDKDARWTTRASTVTKPCRRGQGVQADPQMGCRTQPFHMTQELPGSPLTFSSNST
jgi:hypothetical protein